MNDLDILRGHGTGFVRLSGEIKFHEPEKCKYVIRLQNRGAEEAF